MDERNPTPKAEDEQDTKLEDLEVADDEQGQVAGGAAKRADGDGGYTGGFNGDGG
jgi:hypothetical protein